MFKRKVYNALTEWKEKYSKKYAAMLEGARRVGKSTVAEEFAKNNFRSYIKVDFANVQKDVLEVFDDIAYDTYFDIITPLKVAKYKGWIPKTDRR